MRWRSLGVLALLLALLAGTYYMLDVKARRSEHDAKRIFPADEKEVDQISIRKGGEQIVLKREGDGWRLVEPVQANADRAEVNSLLHSTLAEKQERSIEEQPKSLGEYGLERPATQLTLHLTGGKGAWVLLLGDKNPSGFSVYAKRGDQPMVFLVADALKSRLDRRVADFRDKTVLALEPDKVKQVDLIGKGRTISLTSPKAEEWKLTQPINAPADASAVRQLLWNIKGARVRDFLASGPDAKRRYGLDHPDLTVSLQEADVSKRLLLRKSSDPKVGLYAMAQPGEGVVTVDARLLTDLSKSPFDLRDRSLLRFETTDVKVLRLRRGEQSLTLTKEGDGWKLTAPTQADAQTAKVYDLLYSVKELRYLNLAQEKGGDLTRYGLKAPQAEVELSMADGTRLPALLIGKPEKDQLYAKLSTTPAIYAIDPKFLDRLPNGPDVLKQEGKPAPGK